MESSITFFNCEGSLSRYHQLQTVIRQKAKANIVKPYHTMFSLVPQSKAYSPSADQPTDPALWRLLCRPPFLCRNCPVTSYYTIHTHTSQLAGVN